MCLPVGASIWPDSLIDDLMMDFKGKHPKEFEALSPDAWWEMRARWINRAAKYDSSQRSQFIEGE